MGRFRVKASRKGYVVDDGAASVLPVMLESVFEVVEEASDSADSVAAVRSTLKLVFAGADGWSAGTPTVPCSESVRDRRASRVEKLT